MSSPYMPSSMEDPNVSTLWESYEYDDFMLIKEDTTDDEFLRMEIECESSEVYNDTEDPIGWSLADDITAPALVTRSTVHLDHALSPPMRSLSPINAPTSHSTTEGIQSPHLRMAPPRTVSDNSTNLQWQFQQNARRFTELMRRSDQTRSIVRQCRPQTLVTPSEKGMPEGDGEDDRCIDFEEDPQQKEESSSMWSQQTDFYDSERCQELEKSRRKLYHLLTANYLSP